MTTTDPILSRSKRVATDVTALLRARHPLLWIVTKEEARVEGYLAEAAKAAGYVTRVWDIAQGVAGIDGKQDKDFKDPDTDAVLKAIRGKAENGTERGVWIMRDLGPWIIGPAGVTTLRQVRNLARLLPGVPRDRAQALIVLSTSAELPPELAGHATVIDWPLPDRTEIGAIFDAAIEALPEYETDPKTKEPDTTKPLRAKAIENSPRDAAIDAAIGLTGEEAAACYARALVQTKRIDARDVGSEKKRIIARERVLEWFDPIPGGLDAVGGLENLKSWLVARKSAYSQKARDFGLPVPKGTMIVGVSGCGKSLTSKAIATTWGVPLLRVDLGALKSKFVGESEGNLRKVFRVVEAIGRCVLWFDEVEKALQGATGGSADGGVSSDALGAILTWMQERTSEAFVIMTANDVSSLPPEFLRKGRFDEMWFVDLPNDAERVAVLKTALNAHGRSKIKINHTAVADKTKNFTGAEIAAIVPDALYAAFAEDRDITTADLLAAAEAVVPLSQTADTKIKALRDWAKDRARRATADTSVEKQAAPVRTLDFED